MTFPSRRTDRTFSASRPTAETVAEHRTRLAHEQEVAQQLRTDALAAQVSITNSPSQRICVWERLHGLPLPRGPNHRLLEVIADATQLHIDQVREVQKLRVAPHSQAGDTGGESGYAVAP
jgi:hypothetical protein